MSKIQGRNSYVFAVPVENMLIRLNKSLDKLHILG